MTIIPQIIGFFAVVTFLLSYQQKERKNIIIVNVISRCLYILQYLLLGAFSGAILDILGAIASLVAGKKNTHYMKNHKRIFVISITTVIIIIGITIAYINKSYLDLFSLAGLLLHSSAFWMNSEKNIRRISLLGSPFWFVYNFSSRAYGSAIGDILTMCSIVIAMIRHRTTKNTDNI